MLGDAAWYQPSPVALVLCSSSSHPLFVCAHASHFPSALPLLSPLHLPPGQIMPVTFNAPLNTLSSQQFLRELLHLTRQGTKCPLCCHSEDRWGSMQVCFFSTQPCSCPFYGLYDNLLLSALQQPLLHHTLHLLFGPCSLPLRGLHLPHCSLDNWSYGTPHGSK